MHGLAAKLAAMCRRASLHKDLPEPEPVYGAGRTVTSFFASLSPDQQKRSLEYRGPENHGDPELLRNKR
jgi:hypothetical protein